MPCARSASAVAHPRGPRPMTASFLSLQKVEPSGRGGRAKRFTSARRAFEVARDGENENARLHDVDAHARSANIARTCDEF